MLRASLLMRRAGGMLGGVWNGAGSLGGVVIPCFGKQRRLTSALVCCKLQAVSCSRCQRLRQVVSGNGSV